jgi:hypothetical protein
MVASLIGDVAGPMVLLSGNPRMIGTIIPNVTLEEVNVDNMTITDHPVETGAQISDHAFMLPAEVQMTCGWSNSTAKDETYARTVYQALLALQRSRQPFNVSTGKRQYRNMLIRTLMVTTNAESENTLMVIASLRQVLITSTDGGGMGAMAAMALPSVTFPMSALGSLGVIPYAGLI